MELTKQHKVLLAVVALGACAVGVDRLLLAGAASGPQQAAAAGAAVPREPSRREAAPSERSTDHASGRSLRVVLSELDAGLASPDVVTRPTLESAFADVPGPTIADEGQSPPAHASTVLPDDARAASLKLSTVMLNPRPMAFIAGQKFEVGDEHVVAGSLRVKLLAVQGPDRTKGLLGSATVLIDGEARVQLRIDRSL